jgi:hypothetical protein
MQLWAIHTDLRPVQEEHQRASAIRGRRSHRAGLVIRREAQCRTYPSRGVPEGLATPAAFHWDLTNIWPNPGLAPGDAPCSRIPTDTTNDLLKDLAASAEEVVSYCELV